MMWTLAQGLTGAGTAVTPRVVAASKNASDMETMLEEAVSVWRD